MPPKVQSNAALRAAFAKADTSNKPSQKEHELAKAYKRFDALTKYLRCNWDGETIVMPMPRKIIGEGLHWVIERDLKQQFEGHIKTLEYLKLFPAAPKPPPLHQTLAVTLYLYNEMDAADNLHARLKWPLDWLKHNGWMIDDSPAHLTVHMQPQQIDRKVQRIEFRVVLTAPPRGRKG